MKRKQYLIPIALLALLLCVGNTFSQHALKYPIVDTRQVTSYDTTNVISQPVPGDLFYGQDATYSGFQPAYQDNGDGTVTDLITGLMWQQTTDQDGDGDIDYYDKMSYDEALAGAETFSLAGYDDWRLPSIKEMYSLFLCNGVDPSGQQGSSTNWIPFIDDEVFGFAYGDESAGERPIDSQYATSTLYIGTTMMGAETMFGVNFADGRIKGYPTGPNPGGTEDKQFFVMYVRGNADYGTNEYLDNGNGTITDEGTGLMWTQDDDGQGMTWVEALTYAENATIAGYDDWRLPNVKELHSILDYTRAPAITGTPAIDPIFNCSSIIDEGGNTDYPFYWTGSTHVNMSPNSPAEWAAYICFGTAYGFMEMPPGSGNYNFLDVHGAGAQRSDPKVGDPDNYPTGHGPQGDVVRVYNFVRLVRDADNTGVGLIEEEKQELKVYPNPVSSKLYIDLDDANSPSFEISILNINGQVIKSFQTSSGSKVSIDVSSFSKGIYFLKIVDDGSVQTTRFIKK